MNRFWCMIIIECENNWVKVILFVLINLKREKLIKIKKGICGNMFWYYLYFNVEILISVVFYEDSKCGKFLL